MESEVPQEFISDQGLYYPVAPNYYSYYSTGIESPSEWDDQHKFFGLDGQDLQLLGLPNESSQYLYYTPTPSYEYPESPYNPYNPYIPGAVIGADGQLVGTPQYFNSYQQPVSAPAYIPVVVQPGSDAVLNNSHDPSSFRTAGGKYIPSLSSMMPVPSIKVPAENPTFQPFCPPALQMLPAAGVTEGSLVGAARNMHGMMTTGSAPHMVQGADHLSHGRVPSVYTPLKITMPANNGFTNLGSDVCGWAPGDRIRPRAQFNGVLNRSFGEQNRGPRINRARGQLTSPIALRAYTTKAGTSNLDGNIIVYADQYNRDDFPVDYPDAKFFVIKSYSEDDVHKSIKYNVWSSTSSGNKRLDVAYEEAQRLATGKPRKCPVFLFFSVNASGHFCGVAEMLGPVDFHKDMDFWLQDKWTGSFPVKWHIIKDVPNSSFRHIILVNNEYRPVTSSRDTQEIPYLPGINMLTIFKTTPLKTSILDDFMHFEERQKIMEEEKSRILGKSYETSLPLPTAVSPNTLCGATNNESPQANENQQTDTTVHPPVTDGKEPAAKFDHPRVSNDKQLNCRTEGDATIEGKQQNEACDLPSSLGGKQPNGIVNHPSTQNGDGSDNAVDQPQKGGREQLNGTASPASKGDGTHPNSSVTTSRGTDRNSAKHGDLNGAIKERAADGRRKHSSGARKGPKANNLSTEAGSRPGTKDGETDIVTVGSMQIKVNKSNSSLPLTLGSIPADMKGLKLK